MTTLPDEAKALIDSPTMATVATVEPDGQPQLSVVWVTREGEDILFSTAAGRRKPKNLGRDNKISVLMYPAENPYQYLEVRGTATVTEDPEASLINELSHKYTGKDYPALPPGELRVTVRVTAEKVHWRG
jgi:PPOX class probable F420-dependent enzyme